jgi:hypothetical protein
MSLIDTNTKVVRVPLKARRAADLTAEIRLDPLGKEREYVARHSEDGETRRLRPAVPEPVFPAHAQPSRSVRVLARLRANIGRFFR